MEKNNYNHTIIPDEEAETSGNIDAKKSKQTFCIYAVTQQVFLRASAENKITLLSTLFREINRHPLVPILYHSLSKYYNGKLTRYMQTLDYPDYIPDINLPGNNRTMDEQELKSFFDTTLFWFKNLDNAELRLGIFLSLLSLSGNSVILKLVVKMKEMLLFRYQRISQGLDKSCSYISRDSYTENFDENDPDVQLIYKKRKEWDEAMKKYRNKIELSILELKDVEENPGTSKTKVVISLTDNTKKTKKKGKNTTDLKSKSKTGKHQKKDVNETIVLDFIQIMPIWISMQIFKYLDAKTLKIIQDVNKYWEFVVNCVNQEEKDRKKTNTWIGSMQAEFGLENMEIAQPLTMKPQFRFKRRAYNQIACDPRVHNELDSMKNSFIHYNSLLQSVANAKFAEFAFPVINLRSFQRVDRYELKTEKFLHTRPSCVYFDNAIAQLMPIKDIPANNEKDVCLSLKSTSLVQELANGDYNDFGYSQWALEENLDLDDEIDSSNEVTQKMSKVIGRSIALFNEKALHEGESSEIPEEKIEENSLQGISDVPEDVEENTSIIDV